MQKIALVTGASSGIGLELARLLARDGYDIYLVARDEKRLKEISEELHNTFNTQVTVIVQDLSVSGAVEQVMSQISSPLDVVINAAGFGLYGLFIQTDLKREEEMIQVNIRALTELTKRSVRGMVERKSGYIMNIASTAAFQPGPRMAIYYATKAYVVSFSQALAHELKNTGVTVTTLCPGPTETKFESSAELGNSQLFKRLSLMSAQEVAAIGYAGMMQGKTLIIPGWHNKIFAFMTRFFPIKVITAIAGYLQRPI